MVCNMLVATVAGTLVPLGLKALKIDPALASSVFITTFTDVVGFASFLGFATIFIRYLATVTPWAGTDTLTARHNPRQTGRAVIRQLPDLRICDAVIVAMPLYTADALVLRTYKLAEADRIVVFLTRDRGKKRGVAPHARRPRSRFSGALEPLTEVRVAYFEKERRELVRSELRRDRPVAAGDGQSREPGVQPLLCRADRRLGRRRGRRRAAVSPGRARCSTRWRPATPVDALARYFECWLLRLQGVYPSDLFALARRARVLDAHPAGHARRRSARSARRRACCASSS